MVRVRLDPAFSVEELMPTVSPVSVVAVSEIGFVKPLDALTATMSVVDWPRRRLTELVLGITASAGALTVTLTLEWTTAAPLVSVIAIAPVPVVAVVDAATVAVTVDPAFTLAGLKVTATPPGAVAVRAIGFV
jgi:hypothetical protein